MSSVPKQSPARPTPQAKKSARKAVIATAKPTAPKLRPTKSATQSHSRTTKTSPMVAPIQEDLSKYVPSRSVLTRGLKLAKIDPARLDDAYATAKPKKK